MLRFLKGIGQHDLLKKVVAKLVCSVHSTIIPKEKNVLVMLFFNDNH